LRTRWREELFMKRFTVALLVLVISMLVVVAPASASVLRGTFESGLATPVAGSDQFPWGPTTLVPSGQILINPGAAVGIVARDFVVACNDPDVMPFPAKIQGMWVKWGPGEWVGGTYTVTGTWLRPPLYPPFVMTLKATPLTGDLCMYIETVGSDWGWDHWELYGTVK
jgi:hypothetical protein